MRNNVTRLSREALAQMIRHAPERAGTHCCDGGSLHFSGSLAL